MRCRAGVGPGLVPEMGGGALFFLGPSFFTFFVVNLFLQPQRTLAFFLLAFFSTAIFFSVFWGTDGWRVIRRQ